MIAKIPVIEFSLAKAMNEAEKKKDAPKRCSQGVLF